MLSLFKDREVDFATERYKKPIAWNTLRVPPPLGFAPVSNPRQENQMRSGEQDRMHKSSGREYVTAPKDNPRYNTRSGITISRTSASKDADIQPLVVQLTKIATLRDNELRTITEVLFRTSLESATSPVFQDAVEAGAQYHVQVTELKTRGDPESTKKLPEMAPPFLQVWAAVVDRARKMEGHQRKPRCS